MNQGLDIGERRTDRLHLELSPESGWDPQRPAGWVLTADAGAEQHRRELPSLDLWRAAPSVAQVAGLTGSVVEDWSQAAVHSAAAHMGQLEGFVSLLVLSQMIAGQIRGRGLERLLVFPEDGGRAARQRGVSL